MKHSLAFFVKSLVGGLLVVVPIYLAVLLLLKGMKSVMGLGTAIRLAPPGLDSR